MFKKYRAFFFVHKGAPMISYAQNFEDVMLWRALKNVTQGFYIDVGAWSPDVDSVTRHFYENGWRGINIEPNPTFYAQYLEKRPEDINIEVALSDVSGTTQIYFVSNPGLSSLDATIAKSHQSLGCTTTPAQVSVSTLKDVCSKHIQTKQIHFLKVDVEGLEKNVLVGNDWQRFRPWIVLVEATHPMTQVENYDEWEAILLQTDYIFVYADGLNRFYVAKEHQELCVSFKYPPNVFDNFVLVEEIKLKNQVEQIAEDAKTQAEDAEHQFQIKLAQLEQNHDAMLNSTSWKITKPLRLLKKWLSLHKG